ncbi:MAG: hypothetical protein AAFX99_20000 [Myxococcota bacterium]
MGALVGWAAMAGCGNTTDPSLDAPDTQTLNTLLKEAHVGDTIRLTGQSYTGPLVIPPGVTLDGRGEARVFSRGSSNEPAAPALQIEGGPRDQPTTVVGLQIESEGLAVLVSGPGSLVMDSVTIETQAVGGMFVEDLDVLTLNAVTLTGSVTEDDLGLLTQTNLDPVQFPVAGVVVARVAEVSWSAVNIAQFAGFGAVFKDSSGRWDGGGVSRWVGTGVLVEGGELTTTALQLSDTLSSSELTVKPNAIAATADCRLTTQSVVVSNIRDGIGLLQDNAFTTHTDLTVLGAGRAGLWIQNSGTATQLALTLTSSDDNPDGNVIENGQGIGIYMNNIQGVSLQNLRVANTQERPLLRNNQPEQVADGLQMIGISGAIQLSEVNLSGNARVGALLDGSAGDGDEAPTFDLNQVQIEGGMLSPMLLSQAYGVIIQNNSGGQIDETAIVGENGFRVTSDTLENRDEEARSTNLTLELPSPLRVSSFGALVGDGDLNSTLSSGTIDGISIVGENGF